MPQDVAALVDELKADRVGVQLVNMSRSKSRRLVIQAGAFGEHQFTEVRYRNDESEQVQKLDSRYLAVTLPPSTGIRLSLGLDRFANDSSYAFPWHSGEIPVPFR